MQIDVITLFPKMLESPFGESIVKRAIDRKIVKLKIHDMRQWAWNSYGSVDDRPYGGDVGMLIRVDVIDNALKSIDRIGKKRKIILMSAKGRKYEQSLAEKWSKLDQLIIICGRYEGVDERVAKYLADMEISIGDYVLTGGEIPSMVIIDSICRLLPNVLGKEKSKVEESFSGKERKLEYPQYTRPSDYLGMKVPEILLSGNLRKIKDWQIKRIKSKEE